MISFFIHSFVFSFFVLFEVKFRGGRVFAFITGISDFLVDGLDVSPKRAGNAGGILTLVTMILGPLMFGLDMNLETARGVARIFTLITRIPDTKALVILIDCKYPMCSL